MNHLWWRVVVVVNKENKFTVIYIAEVVVSIEDDLNQCYVSRTIGIPRYTVQHDWNRFLRTGRLVRLAETEKEKINKKD